MRCERREIPILAPRVGEEEARAVSEVIMSGRLVEGPKVQAFEEAFAAMAGVRHAVVCFNGTVALHLLWKALGIGPGDEVIVPSMTFISTAVSLLFVGATPVFAEVDRHTFNLDPDDVAKRITARTKAIMPVHYGGQVAMMDELGEIAASRGIMLCEDAAEAAGAYYKGRHAGSFGSGSIFSFTPSKNMTTGEGGMVTTDDPALAAKVRLLKNHGQDREYHHVEMGYNYRMTEMQAAMGLVQLERLKGTLEIKSRNARFYDRALSQIEGVTPPFVAEERNHTYMLYTLLVDEEKAGISRDELAGRLREKGIQAKIYFPPAHLQPVFRELGHREGGLPVTEGLAGQILSLPVHSLLTEEDLQYVVGSFTAIVREHRASRTK
ncbi:MAG: DegT/DnrJ/EryC1/StrS family aminotransferase [Candidatus Eremiobacteraeota bacterium]|nr:DegT/DnrJ/EryC1/StrS family aminotransferase [Candidatus Eremiobacteraeota bacterium]